MNIQEKERKERDLSTDFRGHSRAIFNIFLASKEERAKYQRAIFRPLYHAQKEFFFLVLFYTELYFLFLYKFLLRERNLRLIVSLKK